MAIHDVRSHVHIVSLFVIQIIALLGAQSSENSPLCR
jgi:hypothetical protein